MLALTKDRPAHLTCTDLRPYIDPGARLSATGDRIDRRDGLAVNIGPVRRSIGLINMYMDPGRPLNNR